MHCINGFLLFSVIFAICLVQSWVKGASVLERPGPERPTLKSKKTPIFCWSGMGFERISGVCLYWGDNDNHYNVPLLVTFCLWCFTVSFVREKKCDKDISILFMWYIFNDLLKIVVFLYPNIMSNAYFWINYNDKENKRCSEPCPVWI